MKKKIPLTRDEARLKLREGELSVQEYIDLCKANKWDAGKLPRLPKLITPTPAVTKQQLVIDDKISGTENDFFCDYWEWEWRVVMHANEFRVHRMKHGKRIWDQVTCGNLPDALRHAVLARRDGYRTLVYCNCESGRFTAIEERMWLYYLREWKRFTGYVDQLAPAQTANITKN